MRAGRGTGNTRESGKLNDPRNVSASSWLYGRGEVQAGVQEALDDAASELAEASEADLTEIEGLTEKARGKRKATRKRRVHATYEVRGAWTNSPPGKESADGKLTLRCYPLRRHRR